MLKIKRLFRKGWFRWTMWYYVFSASGKLSSVLGNLASHAARKMIPFPKG